MGQDNKGIVIKTDTSIKEVPNTKTHSPMTETPTHTIQDIQKDGIMESSKMNQHKPLLP